MLETPISPWTNWRSLPWVKIYTKLYKLQHGIYEASKECDTKQIYELQKSIINSSDIKIIAIQNVLKNLVEYYIQSNKIKIFFNDRDKWILYQSLLFCQSNNRYIKFIINKVKEYIAYICIIPEAKAKLDYFHNTISYYNLDIIYRYSLTQFMDCKKCWLYRLYETQNILSYQYKLHKLQSIHNYLNAGYLSIKKINYF